ncbi:S66 peptidase family protein [Legionella pneumophila]|uniref:S66 peptidase family protein n=1 Tax=Legionella pneumophila TaxID=446 RepID=UPI003A4C6961
MITPLRIGDTIGLITPSSPMMPGRLESGISYLQQKGFKVKVGKHVHDSQRFMAGDDENRAQDIMDFFLDQEVKAIMATGGGYGSQRILPFLDYDVIRANPKILTGFSDTTALQSGLLKKAGIISCTGFVFGDLDDDLLDPLIERTLFACLQGESFHIDEGQSVYPGTAKRTLIGGNLESWVALLGTPYQSAVNDSILLLEDVGAEPFQVDCRLSQLDLAGIFKQVSGVIFGQFARCKANYFPERDGTVEDVIDEWSSRINVPCIKNFPYGHIPRRCVLPLGKEVLLNADQGILTV